MKRIVILILTSIGFHLGDAVPCSAEDSPAKVAGFKFFETRIRPLLADHCCRCHGPDQQKSNLRLDSEAAMKRGGASGETLIVPGEPEKSVLIQMVRHADEAKRMPRQGKLSEAQIADLVRWVKMGAPYPPSLGPPPKETHWAFQPPAEPALPAVKDTSWPRSPLDHFVLAGLESKGLKPAVAADPRTLIRRATFDLIGLPPTPEEVEAFVKESAERPRAAYEALIDRLLASPAYGEHWARHWLDVVRYADSNGLDENVAFGNAWRYRDYVVAALNNDKPYDRFLVEQIAGDLLPASSPANKREQLIATGFLALGAKVLAEPDAKKMEMDIIDEQVDTLGRTVMGLTLGCVRCHDHKFDPFIVEDYYGLAGIFMSTKTMEHFNKIARWHENPIGNPEDLARKAEHDKKVAQLKETIKKTTEAAELKKRKAELAALEKAVPEMPTAMGATEGSVLNATILLRGNHLTPGKVVPRHFPVVLAGEKQPALEEKSSGRLALANWLTRKEHPLTARVMVNRVWRWHFGKGLVRSVDNFGRLGDKPTHPELLDWLALRFADGWSLKALHRQIMLSATYQMSSAHDATAAERDPDNRMLWRMNVRRLEAEAIRDSLLAVSGRLDCAIGGPSLQKIKNRDYVFDHTSTDKTKYDIRRRSIYLPVIRNNLYDVFQLFDATDATAGSSDRATTTVATQALFVMNGPPMTEAAEKLAARLLEDKNLDDAGRFRSLYLAAYGRPPSERELQRNRAALTAFERDLPAGKPDAGKRRLRAWTLVCHVILAANEFIYVN